MYYFENYDIFGATVIFISIAVRSESEQAQEQLVV